MTQLTNDSEKLATRARIRKLYCQGATDDEFVDFIRRCHALGLNPEKDQIQWIKSMGAVITRDGYAHIANRHSQFDGMESDVVYEGDKVSKREDGSYHIEFGDNHFMGDDSKMLGAICNVFRKDRSHAISVAVRYDMVKKDTRPWNENPNNMLLKTAECHAIKKAFVLDVGVEE
jgi:phage recombination protein Bet